MKKLLNSLMGLLLCFSLQAQDCLDGYSYLGEFDGHHYYLSNNGVNPSTAYVIANGMGVYLASITSGAEDSWLSAQLPGYITIGLSDVAAEGNFEWHSGEPLGYTNWYPGEPNNVGNEDYTVINFDALGRWNDVPNWVAPRFVIEVEDDDCDGVNNLCDVCPGGDDSVDNNNDGMPDCLYYPGFENLSPDWICGNNKVTIAKRPPGNPNNCQTICVSKNAVQAHLNTGSYVGPCTSCGYAFKSSGNSGNTFFRGEYELDELSVYPNPANDQVNIRLPELAQDVNLRVYDMQGQMIWSRVISKHGDRTLSVDTEDLRPGLLNVVAQSGDEIFTQRLVINR